MRNSELWKIISGVTFSDVVSDLNKRFPTNKTGKLNDVKKVLPNVKKKTSRKRSDRNESKRKAYEKLRTAEGGNTTKSSSSISKIDSVISQATTKEASVLTEVVKKAETLLPNAVNDTFDPYDIVMGEVSSIAEGVLMDTINTINTNVVRESRKFYSWIGSEVLRGSVASAPTESEWYGISWLPLRKSTLKRKKRKPSFYSSQIKNRKGEHLKEALRRSRIPEDFVSVTYRFLKKFYKQTNMESILRDFKKSVENESQIGQFNFDVRVNLPTSKTDVSRILGKGQARKMFGKTPAGYSNDETRPFIRQSAQMFYRKRLSKIISDALKGKTTFSVTGV